MLARELNRFGVTRIHVPYHAHARVARENPLQADCRFGGAIGHNHLAGVLAEPNSNPATMME